jgi:hypothetical protein
MPKWFHAGKENQETTCSLAAAISSLNYEDIDFQSMGILSCNFSSRPLQVDLSSGFLIENSRNLPKNKLYGLFPDRAPYGALVS